MNVKKVASLALVRSSLTFLFTAFYGKPAVSKIRMARRCNKTMKLIMSLHNNIIFLVF